MRSDTGPFSIIPEWLLGRVTPTAYTLYGLLARYADDGGRCWPSRRTMAERLSCSVSTVDRAVDDLCKAGALVVTERKDDEKGQLTNDYRLLRVAPSDTATPLFKSEQPPLLTSDAQNESHLERDSVATQRADEPPPAAANGSKHPTWRTLLDPRLKAIYRQQSYDLVAPYADVWDALDDPNQHIALVVDFIERVCDERLPQGERSKVAALVRRHGKATLLGYDRALGATKEHQPHDWFRYARGVINRFIAEQEASV